MVKAKGDYRPQRGGWAPGTYLHACFECDESFLGDKRAVICADCAYAEKVTGLVHVCEDCWDGEILTVGVMKPHECFLCGEVKENISKIFRKNVLARVKEVPALRRLVQDYKEGADAEAEDQEEI